jgi:hypothetical protein
LRKLANQQAIKPISKSNTAPSTEQLEKKDEDKRSPSVKKQPKAITESVPSCSPEQLQEPAQPSHVTGTSKGVQKAKDLYHDIKDVRDELNILRSVAQLQEIVQKGLAGKDADVLSTYVVKEIAELDSVADRIQSAVSITPGLAIISV